MNVKNEKVVLAIINYYKGLTYFEQNNLNNALKFTNIAYEYSSKIGLQSNVLEITLLLSKIYKKMGRADLAYQYLLENKNYQDSLNSRDVAAQLALSNAGYEFGKKENYLKTEIEAHEQKSSVFFVFYVILLCSCLSVYNCILLYQTRA